MGRQRDDDRNDSESPSSNQGVDLDAELATKVVDTVRESMLILDSQLKVVAANQSFYDAFQVDRTETEGRLVYELGNNQWDIPELRRLLEEVLPRDRFFNDFQVDHFFESIGRRVMRLNARRVDHIQKILLAIEDFTEHFFAENRRAFLLNLMEQFVSCQDPLELARQSASRIRKFTECDRVFHAELDTPTEIPEVVQQFIVTPQGLTTAQECLETIGSPDEWLPQFASERFVVAGTQYDSPSERDPARSLMNRLNCQSLLLLRRRVGSRREALLAVGYDHPHPWTPEETELVRDVFDRVLEACEIARTEKALMESEERFRRAAAATGFGTYDYDVEIDKSIWSAELCSIAGVETNAGPLDQLMSRLVHPDDWAIFESAKQQATAINGPGQHACEYRMIRPDGATIWVRDLGRTYYSESASGRQPQRVVGTIQDITVRKQAELERDELNATLEEQVARRTKLLRLLQNVTRSANEAHSIDEALRGSLAQIGNFNDWRIGHVWILADDNSNEMVCSGLWFESSMGSDGNIDLESLRQEYAHCRISAGKDLVGRVMATVTPQWEEQLSDLGAEELSARKYGLQSAVAFPITVDDGQLVAVMEFFADRPMGCEEEFLAILPDIGIQLGHVFDRRRAEKALDESEERRRAILDAAPDAIISCDQQGSIIDINPATERIFGFSPQELLGRSIGMLIRNPLGNEHATEIIRYLQASTPPRVGMGRELVARRKSNQFFPIRISVSWIEHLDLYVALIHDISQEKNLEKLVVDAAAEEQHRIAGDIHDGVGQELTGLRLMAQTHAESLAILKSGEAQTAERINQWLATIQNQLRQIIQDLVPVEIDQGGLVNALKRLANRTMETHRVTCVFDADPSYDLIDVTWATHLYRIAQEAVRNAAKHADASLIRIELTTVDGGLRLRVSDNGVGIPPGQNENAGFGLRSMAYRAGLINANFTCLPGKQGGTQVTCTVFRNPERYPS